MSDTMSESEIVSASIPADLPRCGIYFLIANGRVVYVGQSTDVVWRVNIHRRAGKRTFDRWHWIPCGRDDLDSLERLYLNSLLPPANLDAETLRRRGVSRPRYGEEMQPPSPLTANPWEGDPPLLSPMELAEAQAAAEEDYQATRERMLAVRKMRHI